MNSKQRDKIYMTYVAKQSISQNVEAVIRETVHIAGSSVNGDTFRKTMCLYVLRLLKL